MSVTHKKSEKQIGAAELEALRASIMAEVEAARAETEESIISSIRNNLVSLPEQGEEWNEKKSYITGDVVTLDGVSYTATHYSRGKSPASNPDKWTRTPTEEEIGAWADLPDGEVITEGTKVYRLYRRADRHFRRHGGGQKRQCRGGVCRRRYCRVHRNETLHKRERFEREALQSGQSEDHADLQERKAPVPPCKSVRRRFDRVRLGGRAGHFRRDIGAEDHGGK